MKTLTQALLNTIIRRTKTFSFWRHILYIARTPGKGLEVILLPACSRVLGEAPFNIAA